MLCCGFRGKEKKKKEKNGILKRKFCTVKLASCFPAAKLKTFWESMFKTENPNIWSRLFVWS